MEELHIPKFYDCSDWINKIYIFFSFWASLKVSLDEIRVWGPCVVLQAIPSNEKGKRKEQKQTNGKKRKRGERRGGNLN